MSDSAIQWTSKTWNPTIGCDKVSEGCRNCYAMRLAPRLAAMGQRDYAGLTKKLPDGSINWTGKVRTLESRLVLPLTWKKPARIFVDSMSDLFHEDVADEFIEQVFGAMAVAHWHTFQILTKRPQRMLEWFKERYQVPLIDGSIGWEGRDDRVWSHRGDTLDPTKDAGWTADGQVAAPWSWPLPNVWLGVSVEDQRAADERIPLLLQTPAAMRFLSCEPLLGRVDLTRLHYDGIANVDALRGEHGVAMPLQGKCAHIDWCIVGGESGPGARPFCVAWAHSLIEQCRTAGVPVFIKQLGAKPRDGHGFPFDWLNDGGHHGDMDLWPEDLQIREFPESARELAHA
jgi:protein gp37